MNAQRIYVEQFMPGMAVDQVFLVRDKDLRTTRKGDLYLTCTLCDRTGKVSARMWQVSEAVFAGIPVEGFLHVKGRTEEYRGNLQLVIDACKPVKKEKVDLAEFVATSPFDIEKMWSELLDILRDVKNKHLRMLIKKFVEDADFVAAFKHSPAAMEMHHAFVGGLLEHTLNVARAAKAMLPLYPQADPDLVLAGCFFHDMGKSAELSCETAPGYTDRGQLVGHITIATIWLSDKARAVEEETGEPFPQKLLDMLQHIVLSHHGVHEYGSPKLPACCEAFMIHYLDNLDAKMWMIANAISTDPDEQSSFTGYLRQLETRVYKGGI